MVDSETYDQPAREHPDAERHSLAAFAKMNLFRKRGQLCDVVVKVGGREFPAHRVVLAASSDYFDAMFSNGMAESAQLEIELKSVSADVMEALLDFVYTGQVRVSMENVQELLPAASLVQMEGVKTVCSAFLFGQVEASNVLGIRRFAELHSCADLEVFAKNYAAHNFKTVVDYEEFLYMTAEELVELLSREDLHIDSEETAYNALIRWVYYDEANRVMHLPNLLSYVRLAIMSVRFLTDIVDNERLIRQSLECRDLVDEAKRFHLRPDLRSQMRERRFHQRNGGDEYLVVIGGFGSYQSPSDSVEMFNPRTHEWSELPNLPISYRYVAACSLGTCVYVIGGFDGNDRLNTVGLLDVAQREDGWRWLAPMHYKRGLSAACTHKGLIYVCGGFDGQTRLRSLEVYHPKIDEWRVLEEMNTAREGAGLVVADDTLYCLGGYDGFQLLDSMEAFDLRRGTWMQCKPMYMRRSGAGCAVIVDTLYVCGGYGGAEGRGPLHLDTVEAYNTRLAQWTLVASMNVPRCYVGACQLAGRVYVAAGYNGNRLLNTVEVFDPIDNTWTLYEESRMHNERCDTGMCVVRFLSYAEPPAGGSAAAATTTTTPIQPRIAPCSHRPRTGIPTVGVGDGVQTQVVQIVTPLLQGHATRHTRPTPPPVVIGASRRAPAMPSRHLPESTGAPPIPGRRVMPVRAAVHEPMPSNPQMSSTAARSIDNFLDEGENEDGEGRGLAEDEEEHLERDSESPAELLNVDLESLTDAPVVCYYHPNPHETIPPLPFVDDGRSSNAVGSGPDYQHPDGAAAEEAGLSLASLRPPSDIVGEDVEASDDERTPNLSSVPSPPQQPLSAPPPGLGSILEEMDANLQRRMTFLRGRESFGSRDSSVAGENGGVDGFEEPREPFNIDGEHDTQHLGRPPSSSALPSPPNDNLLWIHRPNRVHSAPSQSGESEPTFCPTPTVAASGVTIEPDSRSDGEGEEGEGDGLGRATATDVMGEPAGSASTDLSPSPPTPVPIDPRLVGDE
uniref:BTB domain-containing protein n=1 Tax=Mesocestoides corti TaxID=53468 RepID=A0A5K3F4Y7_MESCO